MPRQISYNNYLSCTSNEFINKIMGFDDFVECGTFLVSIVILELKFLDKTPHNTH